MSTDVEERFDNIKHADNDHKLYRGLILRNKMKILLISDSKADMSIAAMDVNIGFKHDPDDLPGLAHLCEHMLLLGTKEYPQQNDYNEYLSQYGGWDNATTKLNCTNYYFNIIPKKLEGALDIFAQFFIAPLFSETLIEKVINGAIHPEHEEYLTKDIRLLFQLHKLSVKPDHPYSKFSTGTRETLSKISKEKNINVRNRLLEFYDIYYSANIMSLCILGKDGLDDLENMVVKRFRNVKNKEVELPVYSEYPFKDEDFNTIWYYIPIHDIRYLDISFALPEKQHEHRMPLKYIKHLLAHESKGSLSSALKAKGWCDYVGNRDVSADTSVHFFTVVFNLTEEGINHVEDIVQIMFQYINMLKKNGPIKWIYDEIQQISNINNTYNENIHRLSHEHISKIAYRLHECPMEEIFLKQRAWRPDLIEELMEYFTPQNIRIYVAAKAYESITNKTEKWYDVKYKKEKISQKAIEIWNRAGYNTDLKLPPKNEFIAAKFDIKTETNVQKFPIIVKDTSFVRVWYKKDDVFYVPKATMNFLFSSPFAYMDPLSSNLTDIFVELLRESLTEYTYIANLAGLKLKITTTKYGITITIDGYDDKQRGLLEKIMDQMTNFEINPERFEILKKQYIEYFKNYDAIYTINYLERILLTEQHWLNDELLESTTRCHVLFEEESKVQKTFSTIVYYATGLRSTESNMLLSLLNQIIDQPCFDILRTTEELGYDVFSRICAINETQYLTVVVQGDHRPQNVEQRIDSFMDSMFDHISTMSEEHFDNHKKSLVSLYLKAPKTISSQGSLYWEEIGSQVYNFNRVNIEKEYLNTITQQQLLQFFKENIHSKLTRRKLSVHVMPTAMAAERNLPDTSRKITVTSSDNKIKEFDNLMSFKLSQSLYPLLEPIDKNVIRKGIRCSSKV
ncbi:insulin-degrading enzyme-like isoform X2 [Temnothorax curvispinosus]|uniref:Insulin-degrading enzyme-like isoform X2 n=1 Tax=Temnothorax curvispinosus TaxID=300111 RepID=A0A6J1QXC0_9HYME|nr:insulin-degrading enzyme-like isoform X2 [Temnothorax curvispinosus]